MGDVFIIPVCAYCRGPIRGAGNVGRPWPDHEPATYCCYGCLSLGEQQRSPTATPRPGAGLALRLGVGCLVIAQSMILALGINLEEDETSAATKFAVQGAVLAGTLLVAALFLGPLLRNAYREVRAKRITSEWLFLLTMFGAFGASLQSWLTGHGPVYFEVVSVLLVVYSLGKALTAHARASAIAATDVWGGALQTCRRVEGNHVREVPVTQIQIGDVVEVRPGDAFAVDGIVVAGVGFVSEAALKGEPFPVVRRPGDVVLAGSAAHDATFRVRATTTGTTRHVDQLLALVELARQHPTTIQGTADRLAAIFFPLLVLTAALTFAGWTSRAGWSVGLFNAMAVLLVACPCALGLATPIVVWSALGRLAERGLVVRSGDFLERMATITHVVCDKTGTLTNDRLHLVDIVTADTVNRVELLGLLGAVQAQSTHPLAAPFAAFVCDNAPSVEGFHVVPGCGVEAVVAGQHVQIGRPEWLPCPAELAAALHTAGHNVVAAVDGKTVAVAVVQERLRPSALSAIAELQELGLTVTVLTGDTPERADALGLPYSQGNLLPDDKRRLVQEQQAHGGKVLFIGDGLNDAAALAVADVGIALSTGTDLANRSATATLYHDDLHLLPWAILLARQAQRIIRRNLLLAASYNVLGVALAAAGLLHPIIAALLMVVSSVLVVWSAARVGVHVEHECAPTAAPNRRTQAFGHAFAVMLQGIILVSLFDLHGAALFGVLLGSVLLGSLSAFAWAKQTWRHGWEMAYVMLTFGNLGMIGGWWADAGFRPLQGMAHCDCATAIFTGVFKPWMWVGMFVVGNLGMAYFSQHRHPRRMWIGGNLGMGIGMLVGGWLAAQIPATTLVGAGTWSLIGMTLGMIGGMAIGGLKRLPG